jgi:O-acetyl-ADP-ribose deacetylase (regulator of RNase III)
MQVHVAQADITNLPVDAIVNPSNSKGIMAGPVAEAIRLHGGEEIEAETRARAPIAIGAAMVTKAGSLPAKFVIHVPTMDEPGMTIGAENVRRAARAALIAASVYKHQVVAFSGMGTGDGGVAYDEAARAIVEEIRAHKKPFPETVYLVDSSAEMVAAFEDALKNAQQGL